MFLAGASVLHLNFSMLASSPSSDDIDILDTVSDSLSSLAVSPSELLPGSRAESEPSEWLCSSSLSKLLSQSLSLWVVNDALSDDDDVDDLFVLVLSLYLYLCPDVNFDPTPIFLLLVPPTTFLTPFE